MKSSKLTIFSKFLILPITLSIGVSAGAQGQQPTGFNVMEEVIVTATKRAESKQDVPIAISVIGAQEITNSGSNDLKDMVSLIPNMIFADGNNTATADISVRGIYNQIPAGSIGFESGVTVYVDGISVGNQLNQNQNLGQIERVEVLRGPQGTLFGKNAIAGAINIITKKPSNEFEGSATLELGDRNLKHFRGHVNLPIADTLNMRLSVADRNIDGFVENTTLGIEDYAGTVDEESARVQIRWTPSDKTTIDFSADSTQMDLVDYIYEVIEDFPTSAFIINDDIKYTQANGFPNLTDKKVSGISLSFEHILDNGYTITSLTGTRDDDMTFQADIDGNVVGGVDGSFPVFSKGMTQELRIASPADGDYDWVAGLYYASSEQQSFQILNLGMFFAPFGLMGESLENHDRVDTDSIAAFGHLNYHLSDQTTLFAGLRYTDETKELTTYPCVSANPMACMIFSSPGVAGPTMAPFDLETSEPSWTLGVRRQLDEEKMVYASVSRGVKTAAFNSVYSKDPAFELAQGRLVADPEFMNNYEVGFKSRLLDSKLELNVAAFYMDYEDMQVRTSIILNDLPTQILSNAASATSKGLDIELRALPTENLMISAGLGLVDATYGDFPGNQDQKAGTYVNANGNKLALAADVTLNAAVQHTKSMQDGTLLTRLDVSYIDDRYSVQGIINTEDFLLESMTQVNARASYQPNNSALTAAVWVRNLTDDDSLSYKAYNNVFGAAGIAGMYVPPRSWGVTLDYTF